MTIKGLQKTFTNKGTLQMNNKMERIIGRSQRVRQKPRRQD